MEKASFDSMLQALAVEGMEIKTASANNLLSVKAKRFWILPRLIQQADAKSRKDVAIKK